MNKLRTISFLVLVLLLAVVIPSAVTALNLKYPKDKAVIDTSTPELSWESVDLAFIYEVSVWKQGSSNLVYHGYPTDTKLKIASQDALKNGVTYIWMVKAKSSISSPAIEESSRWTFSCGQAAKQDDNIGTFKKNGATLVIPVEFKSHKFKGDPVEIVTKKMKEMEDYYRAISYNDDGTMREVACDVAPGIYLNVDRTHYSADKKDSGGNWMRDCGDFGKSWAGVHQMKKAALPHVFKAGVSVREYRHIIYVVPEGGGNNWGSDQFWPASTSGSPSKIKYNDRKGVVSGSYACGIVMGVDVRTGTYNHEFGHQLGLPDLYPYPSVPNRNIGYSAMMGSGNQIGDTGVCMFVLSRIRSYSDKGKKKDWIRGKFEEVNSNKTFWVDSRTSEGGVLGVALPDKGTSDRDDHYIIEVFDRRGVDEDFVGFFQGPKGKTNKATAAVFISYVDNLDVNKIKVAHGVPKSSDRKQNFFLTGGEYKKGNFSIKVKEMRSLNDRWVAKVAVSFDGLDPIDDAPEPKAGKIDKPDKQQKGFFSWLKSAFSRLFGWLKRDKNKAATEGGSVNGFMLGMFEQVSRQKK